MRGVIEVEGVSFEYPGVRALDAVTFRIEAGSITALVGPNGAGKTTLLRLLAALERPLTGRIRVDGIDVVDEPRTSHRRIGYLSDAFGLYAELTVRQCLRYVAAANRLDPGAIPEAVERIAGALEIRDKLDSRAGTLSRGQRQRVAIAQAVIHSPRVLFLDEPASGLDPEARHGLAQLFRRLRDEHGMTLLVSSHILSELEEYSTAMLVLRAGRIVEHSQLARAVPARARLRLTLARPHPGLAADLAALPQVSEVGIDGLDATFAHAGDASARQALLAGLIAAGVPVCGLAEERRNLQDSYLATVHGAPGGSP